jgi:two-component system chemotaxis response regulator CheB
MGSLATAMAAVKAELLPRIRSLVRLRDLSAARPAIRAPQPAAPTPPPRPALRIPPPGVRRVDAIVLGISTGGPNALMEVVPRLPRSLPVPLLIVQHMPPTFTRLLAERLTASGQLPVSEAVAGDAIVPGRAWIAPGDFHMTVRRRESDFAIALDQNPPENSCRPAVDPLFRSAGQAWGGKVLAVIMTGMGQDGLLGCQALAPLGAQIIAQDEASSVVWGMPGAVARAGLPERLIPLAGMADEILRRVAEGRPGFRP